jgi:RsiW-degrading membrane proteinase PrsW (M82 family)
VSKPSVLYRPESAVFWLFVVALILSVFSLLADDGAAINETLDAQLALGPLWLAFIVFLVWLILKFDPFRSARQYPQGLVAATALGATTAIAMAMSGNDALGQVWARVLPPDTQARWSAALTAPFIEEASKAICAALILVLCAAVFNRISHALLVGMFVGFGFDVMEDLSYASTEAINSLDSDIDGAGSNLAIRILTAVPAHWAYTSLAAVGVLLLLPSFHDRANWSWPKRLGVAAVLFGSASFMHFVWDSPAPDDGGAGLGMLGLKVLVNLAVFLTAVFLLLRYERRWVINRIDEGRGTELFSGIAADVLESLPTGRRRRSLQRQARKAGGRPARKSVRAAQRQALDRIQTSSATSFADSSSALTPIP